MQSASWSARLRFRLFLTLSHPTAPQLEATRWLFDAKNLAAGADASALKALLKKSGVTTRGDINALKGGKKDDVLKSIYSFLTEDKQKAFKAAFGLKGGVHDVAAVPVPAVKEDEVKDEPSCFPLSFCTAPVPEAAK